MKKLLIGSLLFSLALNSWSRTITLQNGPDLVRSAGQSIPLDFTAAGFTGETVNFDLVNAHTWEHVALEAGVPVANGANHHDFVLPWSFPEPGLYVLFASTEGAHATGTAIIRIRSAIIWPYNGTTYPRNADVSIIWSTSSPINAEFFTVILFNEDTSELLTVGLEVDPLLATDNHPNFGRFVWHTPDRVGDHFRVLLFGYNLNTDGDAEFTELAQSEQVSIH